MSFGRFLAGLALLSLTAAPLWMAATRLRARLLVGWRGAPARLAESVAVIAVVVVLAELLGTVGAFGIVSLTGTCAVIALAGLLVARRLPLPAAAHLQATPRVGRVGAVTAASAVALVGWQWAARSAEVLGRGMADPDTLWYHMPFAARFSQDGWTTRLHYTQSEPITTFHPASSELLHGVGIAAFGGHDLASPWINLAFAAVALLSGWCLGMRRGVAPAATLAVASVLVTPLMLQTQPGEAANDTVALALLLAGAALLDRAHDEPAALVLGGAAAGLALGTKLSLFAPVALLTVGVVLLWVRRGRWLRGAAWTAATLVAGGFWYARNLLRVGNPLPWFGLHVGPLNLPSPPMPVTRAASPSISHYIGDESIWRHVFLPQLGHNLGPVWPVLLLGALAGLVGALARSERGERRVLGAVGLAAVAAYVVTPATAGGPPNFPVLFGLNLRFATPPLALGLALAPALPALSRSARRRTATLAVLAALALLTQAASGFVPAVAGATGALLAAGLAAAGTLSSHPVRRRLGAPAAAGALIGLGLLATTAAWPAARRYERKRYSAIGPTLGRPSVWAQHIRDRRIGIVGYLLQYPLYGPDDSNRVFYVGQPGAHGGFSSASTCRTWRAAVDHGRYDYLVTAPEGSVVLGRPSAAAKDPPGYDWTESSAAATPVIRDVPTRTTIFRLHGRLDPDTCPSPPDSARARATGEPSTQRLIAGHPHH